MDAISRDTTLPPTYAFRVAKAYNAAPPAAANRVNLDSAKLDSARPASSARPAAIPGTAGAGASGPAREADQAQLAAAKKRADIRRLVAARVEGGIDFSTGSVRPAATGALPLYRHPADKNAAATAIDMGRRVDVQG
jgi:hypothetical protein